MFLIGFRALLFENDKKIKIKKFRESFEKVDFLGLASTPKARQVHIEMTDGGYTTVNRYRCQEQVSRGGCRAPLTVLGWGNVQELGNVHNV